MAGDDERLVTLLEARITDFERNLKKANQTAGREFGGIRKNTKSAMNQMEADVSRSTSRINQHLAGFSSKIGSYGKSFAGGLVGGFVAGGVAGIVSQIGEISKGIATIGDEAKRAGMSAQAFQEWKFVAEQNRIGVDALVDGFKELSLRADEFVVTGGGSAAEAFQRLGYSASELKTKLQDPSALMLEIIGRLQQMDKAAQIRISDELFGGSAGERFVELLDQGEAGIRKTISRAHELGAVFDDDVITKAAELDRRFNEVSTTVGNKLKGAVVGAASALQAFIDKFNEFENSRRMRALGAEVGSMVPPPGSVKQPGGLDEARLAGAFGTELSKADEALVSELQKRYADLTLPENAPTPGDRPLDDYFGDAKRGGGSRSSATSEAERQGKAVRDLIAELEHELATMNLSEVQQRIANEVRRAGVSATSDEGREIASLVQQIEGERLAREQATQAAQQHQEAMRQLGDIAMQTGQSIANALEDGKLSGQELLQILFQVAQQLAGMQGLGGSGGGGAGGILSMLGSLFGMGFAGGGYISGPGGPREDRIPIMASNGEFMVNARSTQKHRPLLEAINSDRVPGFANGGPIGRVIAAPSLSMGAAQQTVHITVGVSADNNGNLMPFVERVSQRSAVGAIQAAAPGIIKGSVSAVQSSARNRPGLFR